MSDTTPPAVNDDLRDQPGQPPAAAADDLLTAVDPDQAAARCGELAGELRGAVTDGQDPRMQALLETSAEVLLGLARAFSDYARRNEPVWRD